MNISNANYFYNQPISESDSRALASLFSVLKKKGSRENALVHFERLSLEERTRLCYGVYVAHNSHSQDPQYGEKEIYRDPTILTRTAYQGKNIIAIRLPQKNKKEQKSEGPVPSFGYHAMTPVSLKNRPVISFLTREKGWIGMVLLVTAVALPILGAIGLIPLGIGLGIGVGGVSSYFIFNIFIQKHRSTTSGIAFNEREVRQMHLSPEVGTCDALPTEHSADTELWRKRLIEAAEENIVISGNYCGGEAFIDLLKLIEKRMLEKPELKVVILSAPVFLKGKVEEALDRMKGKYPNNFSLVECPSIWHISSEVKLSTNHTKAMVIDHGRYFILGGSGIKDNFVQTGLDGLSKEEFLRQQGELAGTPMPASENTGGGNLLDLVLPTNFRDQDWVFSSYSKKNPVGRQIYKQLLLLSHRWEKYEEEGRSANLSEIKSWGLFSGKKTVVEVEDSVTTQLLKTPPKSLKTMRIRVPLFETSAKKAHQVACKIIASGPEQSHSAFSIELLGGIKKAKKSLLINHMYFHPTPEIMEALIAAVKRGVRIELMTCGVYENGPIGHRLFGPRNKYYYSYLMNALSPEERGRVAIYEFRGFKKGNHKKLVVIDEETTIAGSSNFGYKSLVTASDHELNFIARSKKLAAETLKVCAIDRDHSEKITKSRDEKWDLTISESFMKGYHELMAPLIG